MPLSKRVKCAWRLPTESAITPSPLQPIFDVHFETPAGMPFVEGVSIKSLHPNGARETRTLQGHGYLSDRHNDKAVLPTFKLVRKACGARWGKVSRMLVVWKAKPGLNQRHRQLSCV